MMTLLGASVKCVPAVTRLVVRGGEGGRRLLSGGRREGRIIESSVFLQCGHKISELPVVVRKVRDVWDFYNKMGLEHPDTHPEEKHLNLLPKELNEEEKEILEGFNRCYNSSSIFRLLETIPTSEVTPPVAAHAYKKIVELENKYESAQSGHRVQNPKMRSDQPHSFFRSAFITLLLDIICKGKNPAAILEGLSASMRDGHSDDQRYYKEKLLEELLVCVSDGLFSMQDICKAIHVLSVFYPDSKQCVDVNDKLWFGILDQSQEMTVADIVSVFSTLPHLSKSRRMIMKLLEQKAMDQWQQFRTGDIVEMLRVLQKLKYDRVNRNFMEMITRWLSVNIHTINEREMLAIVYSFQQLEYTDALFIKALEKVIKLKGCKIQEHDLMVTISSYCQLMRIRSPVILEGIGQYFIETHQGLSVPQVSALAPVFGQLDFHPPNGFKFWELLEFYLDVKFNQFSPIDMINLLVSFTYIEKFPINFTSKIFNPFFMDRLHSQSDEIVAISRQQLKLFDTAMKLECRGYEGPFLPKETHARSLASDSRVKRATNKLLEPLAAIVGDIRRLTTGTLLASLPLHPLYVVDMMVYPSNAAAASLNRFGIKTENSALVAVLVHPPEHYDRSGRQLVGSQAMRARHLAAMGFRVMSVNMNHANQLAMHPDKLKQYLHSLYKTATAVKK